MARKAKDHSGLQYGRLTVISENLEKRDSVKCRRFWDCKCSCGNLVTVAQGNMVRKVGTKSCGCLSKELVIERNIKGTKHGLCEHPLYRVWACMKQRCYNPAANHYIYYGGKGITICNEWLTHPQKFIEWGETNGYKKGLTIDRINGNKNYTPSNCRWATRYEQTQNRVKTYTKRK